MKNWMYGHMVWTYKSLTSIINLVTIVYQTKANWHSVVHVSHLYGQTIFLYIHCFIDVT